MTTAPAIDVIIPVYNGQDYILDAIRSVEAQTLPPRQIIVIDDGSTDATVELIGRQSGPVPIQVLRRPHRGLSATRNAGIQASDAELLAFLDADDVWYPTKLAEQSAVFASTPMKNLGVVYCQYTVIDAAGQPNRRHLPIALRPDIRGDVFKKILASNLITGSGSGVLVKKVCFNTVGLFNEALKANEDWDMWLRIAQDFSFDYVQQPLVKIRRHAQNMQVDEKRMFAEILGFYTIWMERLTSRDVPIAWSKNIANQIINRLPRFDFLSLTINQLSAHSRQKFFLTSFLRLKVFILAEVLTRPFRIVKRQQPA